MSDPAEQEIEELARIICHDGDDPDPEWPPEKCGAWETHKKVARQITAAGYRKSRPDSAVRAEAFEEVARWADEQAGMQIAECFGRANLVYRKVAGYVRSTAKLAAAALPTPPTAGKGEAQ